MEFLPPIIMLLTNGTQTKYFLTFQILGDYFSLHFSETPSSWRTLGTLPRSQIAHEKEAEKETKKNQENNVKRERSGVVQQHGNTKRI